MDQTTFTQLTGLAPSTSQSARFDAVSDAAGEQLEELLGWPLDPTDSQNQYDDDTDIVGSTRLYEWDRDDRYLFIDPTTTVHSVKIVYNGVTRKTLDADHYSLKLENGGRGAAPFGRYIDMCRHDPDWAVLWYQRSPEFWLRLGDSFTVQVAIDADWAFEEIPTAIQKAWADMIAYELDLKRDLKSQTMLSHSYSRNVRPDPIQQHQKTLRKYVGPNGTAQSPMVLA